MPDWERTSESFYIKHDTSNMYVIPPQPPYNKLDDQFQSQLKMTFTKNSSSVWQFVPTKDFPSWGLLKHVDTKKYLTMNKYPSRRSYVSRLQLTPDFNYNSLFTFRQNRRLIGFIVYAGAKFQPWAHNIEPEEGNPVVIGTAVDNPAARFAARDSSDQLANVHATEIVGGYWNQVIRVLTPKSTYTESYVQKEGFEETQEMKNDQTLTSEVGFSFFGISSKVSYKTTFGKLSSETWYNQTTSTQEFKIYQGESVCVYQFTLIGRFDSYKMPLGTNIHADTDCVEEPPNIWDG